MLEWQREYGGYQDALRLRAAQSRGQFVPGWTDRPEVSIELREFWISWCVWFRHGEHTPSSAVAWVESQFWDRDQSERADLVLCWLDLASQMRDPVNPSNPVES